MAESGDYVRDTLRDDILACGQRRTGVGRYRPQDVR
jgi:hypothetical protein